MLANQVNLKTEDHTLSIIVSLAVAVTISLSPWVNSDSLIIPKLMILFSGALFLIPRLFVGYRIKTHILGYKILFVLASIFIAQMLLVMIVSKAPFAQEFFGRTGRALGFATYFSLIVILLVTSIYSVVNKANIINLGIVLSCLVSSGYSILQRFGFDIFDWVTYTNGIIGTLGNPNFQSSFAAMALLPALVIFSGSMIRYLALILITGSLIFTLYICQSTQGYLASGVSIGVFTLIYFWYRNKAAFYSFLLFFIFAGLISLAGMLNRGPLSYYLYKVSVQSRGEMWRTAITTVNANPIFGVGLDSYGDASLLYRDERTVNGINEFTDNAHNIFLQFAATGGYALAIIYLGIVILSLYGFFLIQRKLNRFEKNFAALFAAWVSFQSQSIISPPNISMLTWNSVISGFLIGCAFSSSEKSKLGEVTLRRSLNLTMPFSYLLLIISLVVMYPWFNADKVAWSTTKTGDAFVAVKAAKMYPESTVRYYRIGIELYKSKLFDMSLDVARSAVKFNPNAVSGWYLVMVNENAPIDERKNAREQVLRLDPLGIDVDNFKF